MSDQKFTTRDNSILSVFASIPFERRNEQWDKIQEALPVDSFANKVGRVLMRLPSDDDNAQQIAIVLLQEFNPAEILKVKEHYSRD